MRKYWRGMVAAGALIALGATGPAVAQPPVKLRIMGMPLSTGNILKNQEQPFFEKLGENVGFPIDADYKPLDSTGIKEFEQLRIMRQGLFDIIALRLGQVSRDEPTILGLDLVGLSPDYETGRKVVDAYVGAGRCAAAEAVQCEAARRVAVRPADHLLQAGDQGLRESEGPEGPHSRRRDGEVHREGRRHAGDDGVRRSGQGLSLGTIDCAVTGPSSANSAGWPETATHVYPLGLQLAVQGYAINLATWNKLTPDQQKKLETGIKKLSDDIWVYSKTLWDDAMNCNAGKDPCDHRQEVQARHCPGRSCGPRDREVRGARDLLSGVVGGLRQGQSGLFGRLEEVGRPARRHEVTRPPGGRRHEEA